MKYKQKVRGTIKQFKVKGTSLCFVLNLRMYGENCLIFNWHSFSATPGISFFGVPTKDDEYSANQRNNIVAVITRDEGHLLIYKTIINNYMTLLMALHHTHDGF